MNGLMEAEDLQKRMALQDVVVLDCRFNLLAPEAGRTAYEEGHLPGAFYADLERDLSSPVSAGSGRHPLPDPEFLVQKLSAWGVSEESIVVVYDDVGGLFAARAWWLLRWIGHDAVFVLNGGLQAWTAQGYTLSDQAPAKQPSEYLWKGRPQPWVWTSEQVIKVASGERKDVTLVDARAKERFLGELEPIDPVAGHVPRARNRPATDNLTNNLYFKSPDELRSEWQNLVPAQDFTLVCMCGSGVTACHNLLALKIAGLGDHGLYAGSWSQWIQNPERPISTLNPRKSEKSQ